MKLMKYPENRVDFPAFVSQMHDAGIMEEDEARTLASMPWSPSKIERAYQQVIVQLVNHIVEQEGPRGQNAQTNTPGEDPKSGG